MTNKEKAIEIGKKYARQYHHNTFEGGLKENEFVFSDEECIMSAFKMAEWKDKVFMKVLLDIAIKFAKTAEDIKPLLNEFKELLKKVNNEK